MYLETHVIHPLASHPNRGQNGAPKTIPWGGNLRSRVSSQCWKRAMRIRMSDALDIGVRTRHAVDLAMDIFGEDCCCCCCKEGAEAIRGIISALITETLSAVNEETGLTANTLYLGRQEIQRLVQLVQDALETLKDKEVLDSLDDVSATMLLEMFEEEKLFKAIAKNWQAYVTLSPVPVDIALFGRMAAADPDTWNVEAAAAVAHAVATHRLHNEVDYFATMDDVEGRAAYIGTKDLQTAVFYRSLVLDVGQLQRNLGDDAQALGLALSAYLDALSAVPKGGMSNGAHYNRPEYVMVSLRSTQPLNALSAFDPPVQAGRDGLIKPSIQRLEAYIIRTEAAWGEQVARRYVLAPHDESEFTDQQVQDMAALSTAVRQGILDLYSNEDNEETG